MQTQNHSKISQNVLFSACRTLGSRLHPFEDQFQPLGIVTTARDDSFAAAATRSYVADCTIPTVSTSGVVGAKTVALPARTSGQPDLPPLRAPSPLAEIDSLSELLNDSPEVRAEDGFLRPSDCNC